MTLPAPYYSEAGITIYNGDCRDILPELEPVDLVLTDPPYGIGEAAGKNRSRGGAFGGSLAARNTRNRIVPARDYGEADWDDKRIDRDLLLLVCGGASSLIIFGGQYYADVLTVNAAWLVWDKDNSGDFADCELAWTNLPGALRKKVWRWNGMLQQDMANKELRQHPTQKPVPLMQWSIGQADHKQKKIHRTILDPFMGSGTTLVAARQLGRKAIGIEISEAYCQIAIKRLQQEVLPFTPKQQEPKPEQLEI